MLSSRMKLIDSSGIRKVFDLAAQLENPVNLSIGQPDFDVPEPVKAEAIHHIGAGFNSYTQTQGILELRNAVRARYHSRYDVEFDEVLICSGVSGALFLALMALVDPGDEFLVPDPYFVMYKHLIRFLGGTPVYVNTYPDFGLHVEELEKKVTAKTKGMLVNSPANPTGRVLTPSEMQTIGAFADAHNLLVISDEIYEDYVYDQPPASMAQHYDRTLVLNGFSKNVAMTGWRLGYALGPGEIIAAMQTLQQYSFVCAPSFAQQAGVVALEFDNSRYIAEYKHKRDRVYRGLREFMDVELPGGAFYIFPKALGSRGGVACVAEAIKRNLLIIPGNVFSEADTHLRISFAATDEALDAGIEILRGMAEDWA